MLIDALWFFLDGFIAPVFAIFINQFGSLEEVGMAFAIISITKGIVSLFAGRISQKIGITRVILFVNIVFFFRALSFIFVTNVYQIFFLQFIAGILSAIESPTYQALKAILVKRKKAAEQFGVYNCWTNMAVGIGALFSGIVATEFGFNSLFVILAAANLIYGLGVYFFVKIKKPT